MKQPQLILRVRLKSDLSFDEIAEIMEQRAPDFEALPGLIQKYYLHDPVSGEYGGLYLWESPEALAAYRESELRTSIAAAYKATGEPDIEIYRVVRALREAPE